MFNEIYETVVKTNTADALKPNLWMLQVTRGSFKIDEEKKGDRFMTVAAQLAMDGKEKEVEWLRKKLWGAAVDPIAGGYARAGNHRKVEEYRTRRKACANFIALSYARAGNHKKVEEYKAKANVLSQGLDDYKASVPSNESKAYRLNVVAIVAGYILAGNHKKVEMYRKDKKISANDIVFACAFVGNQKKVIEYRKGHKVEIESIIEGYKEAKNKKRYDINSLLESYLTKRAGKTDSFNKTKAYLSSGLFSFFQKSFTEKNSAVQALKNALEKASNREKVDSLSTHLPTLRDGNLGRKLREFIKSGLAQEIVKEEVNTVTDFIKALEKKYDKELIKSTKREEPKPISI